MFAGWVDTPTLLVKVAAMLKEAGVEFLESYWEGFAEDGRVASGQDCWGQLTERGFSATQIALWDRGAEFQADIALYWAFVRGGGLNGFDDRFIARLDRRAELKTVTITNGGVPQQPSSPAPFGSIGHGAIRGSGADVSLNTKW